MLQVGAWIAAITGLEFGSKPGCVAMGGSTEL